MYNEKKRLHPLAAYHADAGKRSVTAGQCPEKSMRWQKQPGFSLDEGAERAVTELKQEEKYVWGQKKQRRI